MRRRPWTLALLWLFVGATGAQDLFHAHLDDRHHAAGCKHESHGRGRTAGVARAGPAMAAAPEGDARPEPLSHQRCARCATPTCVLGARSFGLVSLSGCFSPHGPQPIRRPADSVLLGCGLRGPPLA